MDSAGEGQQHRAGYRLIFQGGTEVEQRNATAPPVTETWEAERTSKLTGTNGGIIRMLMASHNVGAVPETQTLGAFLDGG